MASRSAIWANRRVMEGSAPLAWPMASQLRHARAQDLMHWRCSGGVMILAFDLVFDEKLHVPTEGVALFGGQGSRLGDDFGGERDPNRATWGTSAHIVGRDWPQNAHDPANPVNPL